MPAEAATLTKKDFQSDQEVRWCPGCGDYSILAAVQSVLPELGIPREKFVIVSGIGCSSRFPYYMETYGFHGIHGRAPAIATGIKLARPELEVWVATGDGDGLAIGGNHLIHTLRRNVGLKILLFNNRIYGLTKGQASPTSEVGQKTKSTPQGSVEHPFNALSVAIGTGASFVARTVDVLLPHMKEVLRATGKHKGSAFIEIYQNCIIFNDKAFASVMEKEVRDDQVVVLEHGKPLIFGKGKDKGIRLNGPELEVIRFADGFGPDDCLVWDAHRQNPALAFLAAQMGPPEFPTPIGILRDVSTPTFEDEVVSQIDREIAKRGEGTLESLLKAGDTWTVHEDGTIS